MELPTDHTAANLSSLSDYCLDRILDYFDQLRLDFTVRISALCPPSCAHMTYRAARHIAKYGSEPTLTASGGHKEHGEKVHSEHA